LKGIKVKLPFPEVQIDYMRESDLPAVMEIEQSSFTSPWDESSFREGLRQGGHHVHFLVARRLQNPIAFINFWIVDDEAHVANFAVSPDCRNQGIGKYLFAESLIRIRKLGGDHVSLEVRVSNISAQHLYRQFGFRIVGTRKKYYMDNREDAYVFQLSNLAQIDLCLDQVQHTNFQSKTC
jgi:ribosomal-protein-alanine N-acetyltransferase